jgi:hypothetical protein
MDKCQSNINLQPCDARVLCMSNGQVAARESEIQVNSERDQMALLCVVKQKWRHEAAVILMLGNKVDGELLSNA